MAIFNSYVKLPEGKSPFLLCLPHLEVDSRPPFGVILQGFSFPSPKRALQKKHHGGPPGHFKWLCLNIDTDEYEFVS